MEHAQLPPIDVTRYEWARSDKNTSLWQRQALAGESTWALKPRERRDLFLGGQLLLSTPSVFDHLGETAEAAWRQLRFEHPEIALSFKFDKDGKCLIEHYNPRGDSEVWAWVKRTLIVKASSQRLSFSNVRFMISQEKVKRDEAVFLYLYPQISSTNSRTTNITFMFHVDHLYSDGIGIRILAHCFFRLLSAELSAVGDESQARIDWQRNAEHLRPPWTGLMNGNQKTSGSAFDEAVRSKCALLLGASTNNLGLKILAEDSSGSHMSLFRDFSEEESNAILKAIKIKLGLSSTITHLGHAAMFLATLKRSPRQSEELQGGPFISPCFMNGRRYLRGDNNMANCYIPLCQAVGVIVFPDVKHYITLINGTNPDPTKALIRAVTAARTSYQSIRHQNSILSESLPIPEFLASTTSKNPLTKKERADPYFLSDGIIEQHIDRTYADTSSSQAILSVEDVRFAANADGPSLIVRLCSWRDIISLSAEWNSAQYSRGDVQAFLNDVAHLMLSLGTDL